MGFSDIFKIGRGTKTILLISFSVSLTALIFAFFYYRSINRSEDPRIMKAREFLNAYDKVSGNSDISETFPLLDSAYRIFKSLHDYESSFEPGVIYNNKCSSLILKAIYDTTVKEVEREMLLNLSLKYSDSSILVYNRWMAEWIKLTPEEIAERIQPLMNSNDPAFYGLDFAKICERRVKNIIMAQTETPRRLSVSLTNKGTIYRHMLKPDSSLVLFKQALSLWKENRAAESNLSVLGGGDPVKPSLIESLFPPDKNKK
jgi:hypothetical protein